MSLNSKKLVEGYMKGDDWRVKENSNSPWCFGGLNKYLAAEVLKDYALRHVYTEEMAQAYVSGDIHIHDLGGGDKTLYCCGYSLKNILVSGVQGVPNIPTSAPAKHFDSVLNQIANLDTIYQNEVMGAIAFNSFDTLLAPFIKVDKLTYSQVYQSMQNFVYTINSNSRAGAEPAFTNVTFDLTPPEDLLNEYAIVGGEMVSFTYGSCQQEIDMINRAFFEIMIKGDYTGKLFSYPIPTYNIHDRFDWDNPNNKLLWEMAGKYGVPYFANFINSDLDISDVRSMCPMSTNTEIFVKSKQNGIRKMEIGDVYGAQQSKGTRYQVFTNGGWEDAKINQMPKTKIYKIILGNGAEVCFGENHIQPTKDDGTILTKNLTTNMWLPFNKKAIQTDLGDYRLGYAVGAYAGDGSSGKTNRITYSLCAFEKDDSTERILREFWNNLGFSVNSKINQKNVRFLTISAGSASIVKKYIGGDNALNKNLTKHAFNSSLDFKNGFIDGFRATDGSVEKKRLYTSSLSLKKDICSLLASMGKKYLAHYKDDRDGRLGKHTNYRIDIPDRDSYGEYYKEDATYHYYKIVSIEEISSSGEFLYCAELENEDKLFVLANGLVTHNCRLRLDLSELQKRNGGLFGAGDATGSIGVVTINLPRIGYLSKTKDELFERLGKLLELSKDSLEIKRKTLKENIISTGFLPAFDYYVGRIDNHFSTIGIVGMNEMCVNFLGENILSENGKQLCLEIGEYINNVLLKFQEETGNLYNYEATPAESVCYRLALIDKKQYPDIFTQGSGKNVYYTNSCHIPVNLVTSIKETFDHQEDLQIQFSGGTVIHVYLNSAITGDQAKHIVKTVCENYKQPYISLSPISRYCIEHGYIKEPVNKCPICKQKLKIYQRITGYLRCIDNFNNGKLSEFNDRIQLEIGSEDEDTI